MTERADEQLSGEPQRLLYSVLATAEQLDVGRTTVCKLIREGELSAVKIGDRTLIPRDELVRFVDSLPRLSVVRQ